MVLLGGGSAVRTNVVANVLGKVMEEQELIAKLGLGVDLVAAKTAVRKAVLRQPVGELLSYLEFIGSPFDTVEADAGDISPRSVVKDSAPEDSHIDPELYELVSSMPLFGDIAATEQLEIMRVVQRQYYSAGDLVMAQGDVGDSMYILESGAASAEVEGVGLVKEYLAGQYFGELALKNSEPRSATIVATKETVLLRLGRQEFEWLCIQKRGIASLIDALAKKIVAAQDYKKLTEQQKDIFAGIQSKPKSLTREEIRIREDVRRQERIKEQVRVKIRPAVAGILRGTMRAAIDRVVRVEVQAAESSMSQQRHLSGDRGGFRGVDRGLHMKQSQENPREARRGRITALKNREARHNERAKFNAVRRELYGPDGAAPTALYATSVDSRAFSSPKSATWVTSASLTKLAMAPAPPQGPYSRTRGKSSRSPRSIAVKVSDSLASMRSSQSWERVKDTESLVHLQFKANKQTMAEVDRKTKRVQEALERQILLEAASSARQFGSMKGAETMRLAQSSSRKSLTARSSYASSTNFGMEHDAQRSTSFFKGELQPHFGMCVAPTHDPQQVTLQRGSLHPGAIGIGGATGAGHSPRSGRGDVANKFHTTYSEGTTTDRAEWQLLSQRLSGYSSTTTWKEQLRPTPHKPVEHVWYRPPTVTQRAPTTPLWSPRRGKAYNTPPPPDHKAAAELQTARQRQLGINHRMETTQRDEGIFASTSAIGSTVGDSSSLPRLRSPRSTR